MPSQNELFTAQAVKNSADKFLKGRTDATIRERFFLSYLQKAGRFIFNESGTSHTWNVKVREPDIFTTRGEAPQFVSSDTQEQLTIGHAAYRGTDTIDHFTQLANKGPTQIVNLMETKMTDLIQSMCNAMNKQMFGSAASDTSVIAGIRTLFQHAVTSNDDRMAIPAAGSTYGGKSMVLGSFGGSWSQALGAGRPNTGTIYDWPEGSGDSQYDWLASKAFNYTGAWSASNNNWGTNCEKILRRSKTSINSLGGSGSAPSLHMLSVPMYNTLLDQIAVRERLNVSDYARSLGFPDVMNYEGALLAYDIECPADRGYAINPQQVALYSLHDQLFFNAGPEWNIEKQAWLMLIGFVGNFRWNPKYFAEYASYAA